MKAFIFAYDTNYDLGAVIIYAESREKAIELATTGEAKDYIWDTNNIYEIDLANKSGVILIGENEFTPIK